MNFSRFWAATRISKVNCAKMVGDRPRLGYMRVKFSALNVDSSSPGPDPLDSRRVAHASVK